MYSAYQDGQSASSWPVRASCWPCAAAARLRAWARSLAESNVVFMGLSSVDERQRDDRADYHQHMPGKAPPGRDVTPTRSVTRRVTSRGVFTSWSSQPLPSGSLNE